MPLVLVLETGAGLSTANTFASIAESDAYHEARLYATAWVNANADNKGRALAMATSVICSQFSFSGNRSTLDQALCWPRSGVENREYSGSIVYPGGWWGYGYGGAYWPSDGLPPLIKAATCEMARLLLEGDRTADSDTKGIRRVGLGRGAVEVEFDANDRGGIFTDAITAMLAPFGAPRSKSGFKRVVRT